MRDRKPQKRFKPFQPPKIQVPLVFPKRESLEEILSDMDRNKRAEKILKDFMQQFPGKSLIQILPVLIRRCSDISIAKLAVSRIESHQLDKLSMEDTIFLEGIKRQIKQIEETPKK